MAFISATAAPSNNNDAISAFAKISEDTCESAFIEPEENMMDLDRVAFDIECPQCKFATKIFYRDARLRDVLICRGCKGNIQLDDHMNQCRKARKQFNTAMRELEEAISKLNTTITFKF